MSDAETARPAEARFLAALGAAGSPMSSVADIRQQFDLLPTEFAALLLEWIPRLEDCRLQESVAWALLAAPKGTLAGPVLAELFDTATNDELKWAIASVINQTRPRNVEEWLIEAIRDRHSGAARNLLASAIAKMIPPEQAVPVLIEVFAEAPLAAVHPLAKVGGDDVREFLAAKLPTATGPLRREIRQALAHIDRRLTKARRRQFNEEP